MRTIKAAILCLSICASMPGVSVAADVQAVGKRHTNIPAQDLAPALRSLAKALNFQIIFASQEVSTLRTQGAVGEFTPEEALRQVLSGTGLTFRYLDKKTVTIVLTNGASLQTPHSMTDVSDSDVDLLLLARNRKVDADEGEKAASSRSTKNNGVEEMIVEDTKIKPFSDANVDVPRTINDAQAYYIFDSTTIQSSGATNLEDFLKQRLSMNTVARTTAQMADGTNASIFGNASIRSFNLRGLGASMTLILINGRRLAGVTSNGGSPGQPDINGIPLSAIDRIEILPSSASGIYGGSAMGGVINVILKKNYSGGELRATYDNTLDSDAPRRTVGGTYGAAFGGGKTHIMLTGQWSDESALLLQDRRELFDRGFAAILRNNPSFIYSSGSPFLGVLPNIKSSSEVRYNPDGTFNSFVPDPGVLRLKDGRVLQGNATHIPVGTTSGLSQTALSNALALNQGIWNLELPPTAQSPTGLSRQFAVTPVVKSFMASVSQQLSSSLTMTLDWAHNDNDSSIDSTLGIPTSFSVPSVNPFNPFSSAVTVMNPATLTAPFNTVSTTDHLTLGFTLELPSDWMLQTDYTWSRNHLVTHFPGFDSTAFNRALAAGSINPFVDLLAYPLNLRPYISENSYDLTSYLKDFAVRASGPLKELPWGAPRLTVGLEHRIAERPDNAFTSPTSRITYLADRMTGDSAYAEATVPLVKQETVPLLRSLELQVSGRSERMKVAVGTPSSTTNLATGVVTYAAPTLNGLPYSTDASYTSTNNTIGLKYQPLSQLTLRASVATAYLPPAPEELRKNPLPNTFPTSVIDPRNNNAVVNNIQTISGGNPDLKPQSADNWNAGVIWEPAGHLRGLRLNAEYYNIDQTDAIGSISAQLLVNNEASFPGRVVRNAAGTIVFIDTSSVNLYKRRTRGWDFSADYQVKTGMGIFSLHAVESMILSLENQFSLTAPSYDGVGVPSEDGAAKHKGSLMLNWDYNRWSAGWTTRYFGSYKQYGLPGGFIDTLYRSFGVAPPTQYVAAQGGSTIPSQMYHDIYLSYSLAEAAAGRGGLRNVFGDVLSGVTLQLGVKNVFNTLPPFDAYYDYYVSPYGDTRLRSYWLSIKAQF